LIGPVSLFGNLEPLLLLGEEWTPAFGMSGLCRPSCCDLLLIEMDRVTEQEDGQGVTG